MSNSYPKLLEQSLQALDSPRGVSPAAIAERVFDALVDGEPSLADGRAFRFCELGQFAYRGVQERVRKDIRNQVSAESGQTRLFPGLDLRYTVVHADGVERQIEHAHMTRPEWLSAEGLLRHKALETLRKAEALERCRLSFDHLWTEHPEWPAAQVFALAAVSAEHTAGRRMRRTQPSAATGGLQ